MAIITYLVIEGETTTDEEIESFIELVRTNLKKRFTPRKVQIVMQDMLPEEPGLLSGLPKELIEKPSGYS